MPPQFLSGFIASVRQSCGAQGAGRRRLTLAGWPTPIAFPRGGLFLLRAARESGAIFVINRSETHSRVPTVLGLGDALTASARGGRTTVVISQGPAVRRHPWFGGLTDMRNDELSTAEGRLPVGGKDEHISKPTIILFTVMPWVCVVLLAWSIL